jgi:signal transduction histidine kinase
MSRLLDTSYFTVALYDDLADVWRFPLAVRSSQSVSLSDRPVGRDPFAYVLRRRESLFLSGHVRSELARAHIEMPEDGLPVTWLGAPILAGERVIGVLAVGSSQPDAYDVGTIQLISAIAAEAASAIDNARQYEHTDAELAQRLAELAARNQELKALHALRDDLTDMIVHDLRNPLNVVMTGIDLAVEILADDMTTEPSREALIVSADAAKHMLNMVNTLLDISRIEAGQMPLARTLTDLRQVATTVLRRVERLAGELRVSVEKSWSEDLPFVFIDAEKIERVLVNLLDNAIKFTPPGGKIILTIKSTNDSEGEVEVSVVDSGPGIPAEQCRRIFDKFAQLRTPGQRVRGSGIGLAFCKLAVEAHGGRIWVVSPAPETGNRCGAAFHFALPLA